MRTFVIFQHPAKFVPLIEGDNILAVKGADWFVSILKSIKEIEIDPGLCQED